MGEDEDEDESSLRATSVVVKCRLGWRDRAIVERGVCSCGDDDACRPVLPFLLLDAR